MDPTLSTILKLIQELGVSLMIAAQGMVEKYGVLGFGWRFLVFLGVVYFAKRALSWVFMAAFVVGAFLLFTKYFS